MKRFFRSLFVYAAVALVGLSQQAYANFTLYGVGNHPLGMHADSTTVVGVNSYGPWYVCNLTASSTSSGTTYTPETCRGWYGTLLTGQRTGQHLELSFQSASTGNNTSAWTTLGGWNSPNPMPYFAHAL